MKGLEVPYRICVICSVEIKDEVDEVIGGGGSKWISSDPLVGNVANAIPGTVQDVNKIIKDSSGRIITDLDIKLKDVVIQVKSGGGKGLTTQLENTANATGKTTVGYAPDAKLSVIKGAEAKGYQVFTDLDN